MAAALIYTVLVGLPLPPAIRRQKESDKRVTNETYILGWSLKVGARGCFRSHAFPTLFHSCLSKWPRPSTSQCGGGATDTRCMSRDGAGKPPYVGPGGSYCLLVVGTGAHCYGLESTPRCTRGGPPSSFASGEIGLPPRSMSCSVFQPSTLHMSRPPRYLPPPCGLGPTRWRLSSRSSSTITLTSTWPGQAKNNGHGSLVHSTPQRAISMECRDGE